ncbi:hypothetical protein Cylst_4816 [Cylindrospermum stagnale PCC 7417]|uniref:Uncharacterized protein n=1 Tax=Cylindrospermum stagnale PCC 7417 TaxID=56107 RepID=K9X5E6_9NOST|nr:hypothetical protein [Cylindrospermum stagnale]AFZ26872.1 hypothetical protein Cylst_4816 [Cylindrospermum stagnale PCC 7417]
MNIAKLILLACPAFLASMLLVVNPSHAFSLKSAPTTQMIAVVSAQPISQLATPKLTQATNTIIDQLGCNCGSCVQSKFQMLQGKLPVVDF